MARQCKTVMELAKEAGLDLEEAVVILWGAGFESISSPNDVLDRGEVNRARRALGLATRREIKSSLYWMKIFDMGQEDFQLFIYQEFNVQISVGARNLPPKSINRLKAIARSKGIDPLTGNRSVPAISHLTEQATPDADQLHTLERAQEVRLSDADQLHTPERAPKVRLSDVDQWRTPGCIQEIRLLTEEEVAAIHMALVEDFAGSSDPIDPPGIRSESLLASAVFRPDTSLGDVMKYPTVELSASALIHGLILNHPFHNGNKRTALVALLVFLDENRFIPTCDEDELFKLVLLVAQHRIRDSTIRDQADSEVLAIADWLCDRIRPIEHGEHPLQWRKLLKILRAFGCEAEHAKVGNRMDISREIPGTSFWGKPKSTILKTQVQYGGDGRDAEKNTIKKIRDDLYLDNMHGVDSYAFYDKGHFTANEFIVQYRKILRRLARL